jgi:hypothetical protein
MSLTTNMHKDEDDLEHEARKFDQTRLLFSLLVEKLAPLPPLPSLLAFFLSVRYIGRDFGYIS